MIVESISWRAVYKQIGGPMAESEEMQQDSHLILYRVRSELNKPTDEDSDADDLDDTSNSSSEDGDLEMKTSSSANSLTSGEDDETELDTGDNGIHCNEQTWT